MKKITELREQYLPDVKRLALDGVDEAEARKIEREHEIKIKNLFEHKKARAAAKIKLRQEAFSFAPKKQVKEVDRNEESFDDSGNGLNFCAISKEVLDDSETYYMLGSARITNVSSFH